MNSTAEQRTCPSCGATIPAKAPQGICPKCLMAAAAVATDAGQTGGKRPEPPSLERLATAFPQLEVIELVGQGGMGAVYKARQKQLDRIVALKVLPPGIGGDPSFAERFTREAKALAKLLHPNIVALFEFGQAEGIYYLLMEFVDGVSLGQLLRSSRVSAREALAIVPQICDALQYAHDQGIVHRDIKPENILLDRRGRVKVADFGLAKLVGAEPLTSPSDTLAPSDGERAGVRGDRPDALTGAGKIMGTPNYMAPEQVEHPGEVDHRADIYALGVVFYQMLTGELPGKKLEPPSKKVVIDVRLDEVVLRALEKEPERRYQQVSEVKTMVETIVTTPPSGAGVPPACAPTREKDSKAARLGRLALALCLGGLALPAVMVAFRLPLAWSGLIGITCICELAAFVLGIIGWRSGAGKTAVIVAVLLPLLAVAGSLFLSSFIRRDAARAEAEAVRNQYYLPMLRERLRVETEKQLKDAGVRYDHIEVDVPIGVVFPGNRDSSHIVLANPQELRGIGGSNVWTNIKGSLDARPVGDGCWEVIGDEQLGGIRFTVKLPTIEEVKPATPVPQPIADAPEIERVVVSKEQALIEARGSATGAGMIITVGANQKLWSDRSLNVYPFIVTMRGSWFRGGCNWFVKAPRGKRIYRLDGSGPVTGQIVFRAGMPTPEADGSYVIGEFQPETGAPLPITVRLEKDVRSQDTSASQTNLMSKQPPSVAPLPAPSRVPQPIAAATNAANTFGPVIERVNEPPKLQFIAWQDEWKTNQPGEARHPDGSAVTDEQELGWLRHVDPGFCDVSSLKLVPEPRFLHLWFSQPGFSRTSFSDVSLLDDAGRPIRLGGEGSVAGGAKDADEQNGSLGWHTCTLSPGEGTNLPSHVTVQLRYTTGLLERAQEVAPDHNGMMSLEGGSQLNGQGQNSQGRAFVAIAVDAKKMQSRQFDVVAIAKDGREVLHAGWGRGGTVGAGVRVENFDFEIPLADVAKFRIGTRPIRTVEWKDVVLPAAPN